jgi:hypothetical protein
MMKDDCCWKLFDERAGQDSTCVLEQQGTEGFYSPAWQVEVEDEYNEQAGLLATMLHVHHSV